MSDSFDNHVRRQFPMRPTHPDFVRLLEVVDEVERLKREGPADARIIYDDVVDSISVAYLAANRMGMNLPDIVNDLPPKVRGELLTAMTNAWVEGVFFGVQFEKRGGHRSDDQST